MQRRRKNGLIKMVERIREAPLSHRRRVAFLTSLTITLLIGSVWATVIFPRTFFMSSESDMTANSKAPFERLFDDAAVIFDDMRSGFAEIRAMTPDVFSDRQAEKSSEKEGSNTSADDQRNEPPPRNSAVQENSAGNDQSEELFEESDTKTRSEAQQSKPAPEDDAAEEQESESPDGSGAAR